MNLVKIFNKLYKQYSPQHWWPVVGRDPLFEICVGAILTQNTAWTNVEKAIKCLLKANLMSPKAISACPATRFQKCIRSSGYYKQKSKKLKIFSQWLIKNYNGDLRLFFKKPLATAREELLSLWGIGPETTDSILLYAGNKPIFVIDAYTKRLCRQYNIEFKTYDEYQKFFENNLILALSSRAKRETRSRGICCGKDKIRKRFLHSSFELGRNDKLNNSTLIRIYNEFHALIVKSGKDSLCAIRSEPTH